MFFRPATFSRAYARSFPLLASTVTTSFEASHSSRQFARTVAPVPQRPVLQTSKRPLVFVTQLYLCRTGVRGPARVRTHARARAYVCIDGCETVGSREIDRFEILMTRSAARRSFCIIRKDFSFCEREIFHPREGEGAGRGGTVRVYWIIYIKIYSRAYCRSTSTLLDKQRAHTCIRKDKPKHISRCKFYACLLRCRSARSLRRN